ncbi:MAG: hypothetical protein AAF939_08030 [Planctomycetota bacterium]
MNDSFWSGGASAYADSLRNACHIQMKNLRDRLKFATTVSDRKSNQK